MKKTRSYEVVTYKEAWEICLKLNKRMICDYDSDLDNIGMLIHDQKEYVFFPITYVVEGKEKMIKMAKE